MSWLLVGYLPLFSINFLRTMVKRDKSGFMMALKSFKKLFSIVLVSGWFEITGCGSWLAVALAYVF